ncbi:hypothetical protein Kpho02_22910 [Kitasatospora phosalacinea]|uniref:Uncharacterized protein n=1 Tax=Kitasatospora phosalacinea TaxID=2065 RepID=A0A9W6V281_9ACTN|nr:hypothetical protein [Kitasatospora phosalacinea]GLW69992.1 hypothetical protein Kpho02_22910 [Kitasatospora phosalacinea]
MAVDFAAAVSVGHTPGGALDTATYTYTYTDSSARILPNNTYYDALAAAYVTTANALGVGA